MAVPCRENSGLPGARKKLILKGFEKRLFQTMIAVAIGALASFELSFASEREPSAESELLQGLKAPHPTRCPQRQDSDCGKGPAGSSAADDADSIELHFPTGSSAVGKAEADRLVTFAAAIAGFKTSHIRIDGYADGRGSASYNLRLSMRRAAAVKRMLVKVLYLKAGAIVTKGYGKSRLKNPDDPYAAENRRVRLIRLGTKARQEP
jgi:outer membrane protein OmpA-like peptidoglycan-associated protein